MNSQQTFFEYSYDPPSPEVRSEYDPPFPSELPLTSSRTSLIFSSREMCEDRISTDDLEDHGFEESCSGFGMNEADEKNQNNSIHSGLNMTNGEISVSETSDFVSNNLHKESELYCDSNDVFESARLSSPQNGSFKCQPKEFFLIPLKDSREENENKMNAQEMLTSAFPAKDPVSEASQDTLDLPRSLDFQKRNVDSPSNEDVKSKKENPNLPNYKISMPANLLSFDESKDKTIFRPNVSHSPKHEEVISNSFSSPDKEVSPTLRQTILSSSSTKEQPISFSPNTKVKETVLDKSSLPFIEELATQIDTRSFNPSYSEGTHLDDFIQQDYKTYSNLSEYNRDSILRSPSPSFSSFLTESCSITPFPTDYTTPNSTNPTATPLPSPIPSEVLSNLTSESSPSTPSTVTSSAMFCVSKKLESLANGINVTSFSSIQKENCELNFGFESIRVKRELDKNISSHFGNLLVTDISNDEEESSSLNNRYLTAINNKDLFANCSLPSFSRESYAKSDQVTSTDVFKIPANISNEKDNSVIEQSNHFAKFTKISQACSMPQFDQKAKSNMIYSYSPIMEKSNVAELKEKFLNSAGKSTSKKISKTKLISKSHDSIGHSKEAQLQDGAAEPRRKSEHDLSSIARASELHSISEKSHCEKKSAPPPVPPPRLNSSRKNVSPPPPLPPPPCEDDDMEEQGITFTGSTFKFLSTCAKRSPSPPIPPVRQYLLIPLVPGRATPILLTPPATPQRSSSFRISPFSSSTSTLLSCPSPPIFSLPPPLPPPRQFPSNRKEEQEETTNKGGILNDPIDRDDFQIPKNGVCTRYISLGRELTPVPEEKVSSSSPPLFQSSSEGEDVVDIQRLSCSTPKERVAILPKGNDVIEKMPIRNADRADESLSDLFTIPPPPPLPSLVETKRSSSSHSSIDSSEHISPPPLPPKENGLKISPSIKSPPPPPQFPGTPPLPPQRSLGPLSGMHFSPSESVSTVVLPGLSPCRLVERSPPNDRDFFIFPADTNLHQDQQQHFQKSTASNVVNETALESPPPPPPLLPPPGNSYLGGFKSSCMSVSSSGRLVIDRSDLPLPAPDEEIRKVYATVKNWGWISSYRDTLAIYTQLRPIIQQGPQCGLVALSMASQACQKSVSVEDLLQRARSKGISAHGEMFSAEAMADFATEMLKGVKASVRRSVLESPSEVIKILLEGDLILFPYDSEPNHFPGFHKGMKSHWGLLCGCLVQSSGLEMLRKHDFPAVKSDPQLDLLWHLRPLTKSLEDDHRPSSAPLATGFDNIVQRSSRSVSPYVLTDDKASSKTKAKRPVSASRSSELGNREWCKDSNIYNLVVLYRQGKSRNLIYTPLADLSYSNRQLLEYAPTEDYVIGCVEEGLSKQVVVLHKEKPGLSDFVGLMQEKELHQ